MDQNLTLIVGLAFAAVAGLVFVTGQYYLRQAQLRRRLPAGAQSQRLGGSGQGALRNLITEHFVEERFGVDTALRSKLRRDLIRAGFFGKYALRYYLFARVCTVVLLP